MAARKKKKPETPDDILAATMASIETTIDGDHKGVVVRSMSDERVAAFDAVPFGIPVLDNYLHGGIPTGRITEIFGPESSGKTTLCLHAMAVMSQNPGDICVYVDTEYAFDAPYAQKIGVNLDRVIILQPDWGEQAFRVIHKFGSDMEARRNGFDPTKPLKSKEGRRYPFQKLKAGPWKGRACILVDSVAALMPRAEYERVEEGDFEDQNMAEQARMMSRNLRKIVGVVSRGQVACLFTNQTRSKVKVMFGSPETTPAGVALKFYASSRWRMGHRSLLKQGSGDNARVIGRNCAIQVVKCKLFDPFSPELTLPFTARGIDLSSLVFDALLAMGVIVKDSSWYTVRSKDHPYDGLKWQGTNGYTARIDDGTLDVNELQKLTQVEAPDA